MRTIEELAYGVLFPVLKFLVRGGKALLFGEIGEGYRIAVMSPERRATRSCVEPVSNNRRARPSPAPNIVRLFPDGYVSYE
jgi:hypothetical protein